jgi:hypothetical protein
VEQEEYLRKKIISSWPLRFLLEGFEFFFAGPCYRVNKCLAVHGSENWHRLLELPRAQLQKAWRRVRQAEARNEIWKVSDEAKYLPATKETLR